MLSWYKRPRDVNGAMIFSIMTLSITILGIMLSVVMLNGAFYLLSY